MECLARSERAVEIRSEGRRGLLFFRDGEVWHARTDRGVGDAAALELLGWASGTVEPSDEPHPPTRSVTLGWQNLLLSAAQRADEASRDSSRGVDGDRQRDSETTVVSFPRPHAQRSAPPRPPASVTTDSVVTRVVSTAPPSAKSAPPPKDKVHRAVRIDRGGHVLARRGADDDFFELSAYVARLSELLGESLGLEGFRGLECSVGGRQLLLFAESADTFVAVEVEAGADVSSYRAKAGL